MENKIVKLTAYNMFRRSKSSEDWKTMSAEDKQRYQVLADEENEKRMNNDVSVEKTKRKYTKKNKDKERDQEKDQEKDQERDQERDQEKEKEQVAKPKKLGKMKKPVNNENEDEKYDKDYMDFVKIFMKLQSNKNLINYLVKSNNGGLVKEFLRMDCGYGRENKYIVDENTVLYAIENHNIGIVSTLLTYFNCWNRNDDKEHIKSIFKKFYECEAKMSVITRSTEIENLLNRYKVDLIYDGDLEYLLTPL